VLSSRRIPGSCRPAHSPARGARAGDQPAQTGGRAVHPAGGPGAAGQRVLHHRAAPSRAFTRARQSSSSTSAAPEDRTPSIAQRTRSCCIALRRTEIAPTRDAASPGSVRAPDVATTTSSLRRAGSERVRAAWVSGASTCTATPRHAGRAALPAPLPAALARADSRWRRAPRPWRRAATAMMRSARSSTSWRAAPPSAPAAPATATPRAATTACGPRSRPCGAGDGGDPSTASDALQFWHRAPGDGLLRLAVYTAEYARSCRCCSMRPPRTRIRTLAAQFCSSSAATVRHSASGMHTAWCAPRRALL